MEHHGLSEDQAITRLAREADAALMLRHIKDLQLSGYAGAWFDDEALQLVVATADPTNAELLRRKDVQVRIVERSLSELEAVITDIKGRLEAGKDSTSGVLEAYVDYKTNSVVIGVDSVDVDAARTRMAPEISAGAARLEEISQLPRLSTGSVRAADGTRNLTWAGQFGGTWPCSIGASAEDLNSSDEGFVTAGHCGGIGNDIGDASGQLMGEVEDSTYFFQTKMQDSGWVVTTSNWTATPEVNGYSDGVFSVDARWGGMLEAPVGTTVCRYGQTSGGPDCGQVAALNQTVTFQGGKTLEGITRATGICTSDGDSGGPYFATPEQMQGTNIGGSPGNSCPNPETAVYFQPIKDTVDEFGLAMLTEHGPNAPGDIVADCPSYAESGEGTFGCLLFGVKSQGEPTFQWTSSTGHSSTGTSLYGTCTAGVSVTLSVTNPYGTTNKTYNFNCPQWPIP